MYSLQCATEVTPCGLYYAHLPMFHVGGITVDISASSIQRLRRGSWKKRWIRKTIHPSNDRSRELSYLCTTIGFDRCCHHSITIRRLKYIYNNHCRADLLVQRYNKYKYQWIVALFYQFHDDGYEYCNFLMMKMALSGVGNNTVLTG
jgi:hypothetical protein